MIRNFRRDGYLVVPELIGSEDLARLRAEIVALCRGERGELPGLEVAADEDDRAAQARVLAIHHPHKISELIRTFIAHPAVVARLASLIGPNVKAMQSMLFTKSAGRPGQAWHQDENYIPTRDRSLTAAWIAIDDATVENGCLWAIPGSHEPGVLWPTRAHGSSEFDEGSTCYGFPYDEDRAEVALEVPAGGCVFFHGYLLHRSKRNRSRDGFRRALVFHYMNAASLLPWDWDGRLPPQTDNRDVILVCGEDPYAYKGTASNSYVVLRAESSDDELRDPDKKVF